MTPREPFEALLSRSETARRLGISERALWSLTARSAIPCIRLGRSVRYCPKAIEKVIAKGGAQ
jgi:predicted DNA-binding transcriptional regulator AlpA